MYVLMNDQKNGPHEGQYVDESMEGYTTNLSLAARYDTRDEARRAIEIDGNNETAVEITSSRKHGEI